MKKSIFVVLQIIVFIQMFVGTDCKGTKVHSGSRLGKGRETDVASKGSATNSDKLTETQKEKELNEITNFVFRNASHEERLLAYLFRDYDPVARAVMNTDRTVVVSIDFVLLRIHGLDERSQVLTTTGLVIAEWTDARLTWKPSSFGNLSNIIIKADKLWLPELAVMNGAEELMPDFERIRVLLHSDGRLHWEPGGIFRTTCDIDIALFPFDAQRCPLLIGAYAYHSLKMNITNASSLISTHDFRINGEWHVYRTSAVWNITMLSNAKDGYPHVIFTLHLQRRYKFYIMNIVLPCVMLSVLIMIGFCLPPDAGEKISLGISVLLAFTVFLLMIADSIPRTSLAIPLIVTYLMATMTLGTVSICMTVLVLNIHHRGPRYRIPTWVRHLVLVWLARLVCFDTQYGRPRTTTSAIRLKNIEVWKRRHRCPPPPPPPTTTTTTAANHDSSTDALDDVIIASSAAAAAEDSAWRRAPPRGQVHTHFNGPVTPTIRFLQKLKRKAAAAEVNDGSRSRGVTANHVHHRKKGSSVEEWHELAHVLDRVFFWLLFTLMTVSAVVILLYPRLIGGEET